MFGLFPKKGTIAVGSDADIVIFDPDTRADHQRADAPHERRLQSAYEGKTIKGVVETVLSRGRVVIENGEYTGKPGDGQFPQARNVRRDVRRPVSKVDDHFVCPNCLMNNGY